MAIMLQVLCVEAIMASTTDLLPGKFVQVTHTNQLTSDGYYILGAVSNSGKFSFASYKMLGSSKDRIQGYLHEAGVETSFTCTKLDVVWRIKLTTSNIVTLTSAYNNQYLQRKGNNQIGLRFVKSKDSDCEWMLSHTQGGTFKLQTPNSSSARYFSICFFDKGSDCFGNYANYESADIHIYKLVQDITTTEGQATCPRNQSVVALYNKGYGRKAQGTPLDMSSNILRNGLLAPSPDIQSWICQCLSDSTFKLFNQSRNTYLGYNLAESSTSVVWKVANGYIQSTESQPRYLCYLVDKNTWAVLDKKDITLSSMEAGTFCEIAEEPSKTTTANGVCILRGGWDTNKLAQLEMEDVKCLDLTNISLPSQLIAFTHQAESKNMPIFVQDNEKDNLPESWAFIVTCQQNKNLLLRVTELADREPFFTDRPIIVGTNQMIYKRPLWQHDLWQTLYLPFEAKIPAGLIADRVSVDENNMLSFTQCILIQAAEPCIIRYEAPLQYAPDAYLTFTSNACTIAPTTTVSSKFRGVYDKIRVTSEADAIYLLNQTGDTFIHAAAGSTLSPFRAYLQLGTKPAKHLLLKTAHQQYKN